MGFALFSQASNWVVNAYGECDPDTLSEVVNTIRRIFYSWYSEIDIVPVVEECFELQTFCMDCNVGRDCYVGVTLPRGYGTPEAMWFNDRPVQLFDRWRQWHTGITGPCDCGLKSYVEGNNFPTERDIRTAIPSYIMATPMNPADAGRTVTVSGTAVGGYPATEKLLLTASGPVKTKAPLKSIDRPGGIVKDITAGGIVISEEGGRVLTILAPDEQVPGYTRLKITGLRDDCTFVNIRANRTYFPLFDPFDVVETDNQMVWESMARYLRLNRKGTRNAEEMRSEASYVGQAKSLLMGDRSREIGKSTQTQVEIRSPGFLQHSRLVGRRRRY